MAYEFGVGEYVDSNECPCVVLEMFENRLFGRVFDRGSWSGHSWDMRGLSRDNSYLLPPKQTRVVWINIYRHGFGAVQDTKKDADAFKDQGRIACVPVTLSYCEGEGLD